jgi:hypothetical protein
LRDVAAKVSVIMLARIIAWLAFWRIDRTPDPDERAGQIRNAPAKAGVRGIRS